uniref:Uncharacterized protein n=1 Tax=Cannabis sativa TaxID=3483 RepID=A0A803QU79_CANSA
MAQLDLLVQNYYFFPIMYYNLISEHHYSVLVVLNISYVSEDILYIIRLIFTSCLKDNNTLLL